MGKILPSPMTRTYCFGVGFIKAVSRRLSEAESFDMLPQVRNEGGINDIISCSKGDDWSHLPPFPAH